MTSDAQSTVLDAVAIIRALERGDVTSAETMVATYGEDDGPELVSAITAVALCATRTAAHISGMSVDEMLSGVAMAVRTAAS
jgi:hypothetical protein